MKLMEQWRWYADQVASIELFDLVSQVFLLGLLVYGPEDWFVRLPLVAIAVFSLVIPALRASEWTWYVLALLILYGAMISWYETDNHKYLMGYTSGMLACVCLARNSERLDVLRFVSRVMLGVVMLAAVGWKVANQDYVSGDFFRLTLLADSRFADFAALLTPLRSEELSRNHGIFTRYVELNAAGVGLGVSSLAYHSSVSILAVLMTWWTVAIELAIGLLFVLPLKAIRFLWARHLVLLLFMVTTYVVAIVPGFCWMLLCLAIASTDERDKGFRAFYLAMIALVQFYQVI